MHRRRTPVAQGDSRHLGDRVLRPGMRGWLVVAGRAFDTANFGGPNIPAGSGPRWRSDPVGNLNDGTGGYVIRHPASL